MNDTYSNPSSTLSSNISNNYYGNGAINSSGYSSLNHTNNYVNSSIQNGCCLASHNDSASIPRTNPWTPRAIIPTNSTKSSLKISPKCSILKTNELDVREENNCAVTEPLIVPLEQSKSIVNAELPDIKKIPLNNALMGSEIDFQNNEVITNKFYTRVFLGINSSTTTTN